ncbi:hypothetical protein D9619_001441 [Psilocybe cf. subviscida]|uniref:Uncharacterized protein n=1 Tax=Psilocybe cf. subviscida TaxID=2480587 RepID=A0A8H5F2Q3_9AGAR|nr:hypothetical protein D9619_001441 [Psilocybe cf. subviscida]
MSHSNTFTSSYSLSKYSRSYPVKRPAALKSHLGAKHESQVTPEWQHFTNPVIRLILDIKTSSKKELESIRLRIIWEMNSGLDSNQGQPVVFANLDLLSFAQVMPAPPKKHQAEGLPLKAVYRDTIVGIRYLHNRDDDIAPIYRRFQVSFDSPSEAGQFIDNIKGVCPCKLNPLPVSAPLQPQKTFQAPQSTQSIVNIPHVNPMLPNRGASFMYALAAPSTAIPRSFTATTNQYSMPSASNSISTATNQQSSSSFMLPSSPLRHELSSDHLVPLPMSTSSPHAPSQAVYEIPAPPLMTTQPLARLESTSSPTDSTTLPGSSAPNSLPRASSSSQATNNLPSSSAPAPATTTPLPPAQANALDPVIESVAEATSLYDLSNTELEQAICEVLGEEGFYELLDKISQMIIVRRVVNA